MAAVVVADLIERSGERFRAKVDELCRREISLEAFRLWFASDERWQIEEFCDDQTLDHIALVELRICEFARDDVEITEDMLLHAICVEDRRDLDQESIPPTVSST